MAKRTRVVRNGNWVPIMRPFPVASSSLSLIFLSGAPTLSSTEGMESPALTMFAVLQIELGEIALDVEGAKSIGKAEERGSLMVLLRAEGYSYYSGRYQWRGKRISQMLHNEVSGALPSPSLFLEYQKTPMQMLRFSRFSKVNRGQFITTEGYAKSIAGLSTYARWPPHTRKGLAQSRPIVFRTF